MTKYSSFCEKQTGMERGSLPSTGPRQTHPVGASDTQAGKETQRWLLHTLSVSTLPRLTWARQILKDILNKMSGISFSSSVLLLSSIQSQWIKWNLLLFSSLSVFISFFPDSPSSFSSFSSSSSVPLFSTKTQVIWWNKSSPGPVWPLHPDVNEPRWWDDHTEFREMQDWELRE